MRYSPESLLAFAQAAKLGSFSAAGRALGKSQSTISTAIAQLEIDLGLTLFDRSSRKPTVTAQGQLMLARVQEILAAADRLDRLATELAGGVEPRLTLVLSDTYQSSRFESALAAFERRYPGLELEFLIAEHGDVVSLVQSGRAHIGLVAAQPGYPPDIGSATLAEHSEIALFVARAHPLAQLSDISAEVLAGHRELRLATFLEQSATQPNGRSWSAPSYLMLLEMAALGFGWAPLPRWLAQRFAPNALHELQARGWPRQVAVDAVWSRRHALGPAGAWWLDTLLR